MTCLYVQALLSRRLPRPEATWANFVRRGWLRHDAMAARANAASVPGAPATGPVAATRLPPRPRPQKRDAAGAAKAADDKAPDVIPEAGPSTSAGAAGPSSSQPSKRRPRKPLPGEKSGWRDPHTVVCTRDACCVYFIWSPLSCRF